MEVTVHLLHEHSNLKRRGAKSSAPCTVPRYTGSHTCDLGNKRLARASYIHKGDKHGTWAKQSQNITGGSGWVVRTLKLHSLLILIYIYQILCHGINNYILL